MTLLLLLACTGDDTGGKIDTSVFTDACDRVHGATGILMFDYDGAFGTHTPDSAPSDLKKTTTVAGPMADGLTYIAVEGGTTWISEDGACNWSEAGRLPSDGDWDVQISGDRLWAFDRSQPRGGLSDDLGKNWSAFNLAGTVIGTAGVDKANPNAARAVTTAGILSTDDGGASWTTSADLPEGIANPTAGDAFGGNLEKLMVGAENGLWWSVTGGSTWTDATANLEQPLAVASVAFHPDNGDIWMVSGTGDTGPEIERSIDAGGTFTATSNLTDVVALDENPGIWPVVGNTDQYITVSANADGVSLYLVTAGVGTEKISVGTYVGITDVAATADRFVASVHAVQ